jgi:hypothetical protein
MDRNRWIAAALAVAAVAAGLAWWMWRPDAEREIRRRLASFASDFNRRAGEGLGSVSHAVSLGGYFSEDVRVDLGPGTSTIEGRATIIGMATRLQPRTASFLLQLEDVTVDLTSETTADVSLTAVFRRRSIASGEESIDAREFALALDRSTGEWLVQRVTAIDTLK